MLVIFAAGGLGGGDVKLAATVGAMSADYEFVLATFVYSCIAALAMAVVAMIRHGIVKRTLQRLFGVALSAAAGARTDLPDDSPRVAFAMAVCIGGLLAGGQRLLEARLS